MPVLKRAIDIARVFFNNDAPNKELKNHILASTLLGIIQSSDAVYMEKYPPDRIKSKIGDREIHIINPRGMIIMGRSCDLEDQQRDDFEIIRRHYMHIADIITYDDLLERIDSIINSYADTTNLSEKNEQPPIELKS